MAQRLGLMVIGLVPVAFAIWLATVAMFIDSTDHARLHEQRSHLSARPICGRIVENHFGELRGCSRDARLQSFAELTDPPYTGTLGSGRTEVRSEVIDSGCLGDVLYSDDFVNRDRPILGLRSWDFQLADVEFTKSTILDDVVFTMRYRTFQVFRFSEDRLSAHSVLQIATGLSGMIDHAFKKIVDNFSDEFITTISTWKNLLPLRAFVLDLEKPKKISIWLLS